MQVVKSSGQNTAFSTNKTLKIEGRLIDLTTPRVMGILNVTPDSFFDGGRYLNEAGITKQAEKIAAEGATFIDVGGYSSRPGATDISPQEELNRILPAIRIIRKEIPEIFISVDTFRSDVAKAAITEGASIINDISGGELDPAMPAMAAKLNVPYIVMHMRGTPQTMSRETSYENLIKEVTDYFHNKINTLTQYGISDIIVDPGFGFAKTPQQSYDLLRHLEYLRILNKPLLVGFSRKSMIWKTLNITAEEALNGTTTLNTIALLKGAGILRVHDVREAMQTIKLVNLVNPVEPSVL